VTGLWQAVALGTGGLVAALAAAWGTSRLRHLSRPNYAGRPVPVVLGMGLAMGTIAGAVVWGIGASWNTADPTPQAVALATGWVIWLLVLVGALDDRFGGSERGVAGHLESLARGRPTTGILKLVVGVAAAVVVGLHLADEPVRVAGIAVLVGLGLAVVLPTPGLLAAATVALLLQVAAETVTISRLIEAVPPLRWFDRLGRRPEPVS
jgi:hypothetical protein